jgi:hypothetical protein
MCAAKDTISNLLSIRMLQFGITGCLKGYFINIIKKSVAV